MTTRTITLSASFAGPDTTALANGTRKLGWAPAGEPKSIEVDFKDAPVGETLERALARAKKHLHAVYGYPDLLVVDVGTLVKVGRSEVRIALPGIVEQLAQLPFEVASFDSFHDEWTDGSLEEKYRPPGFSDGHVPLGWAAAFKGAGHDRLVSRRWLEDGPWKLYTGPNDVSLVVFHDLDADAATALDQARPAHARMGISDSGGFLQRPFAYELELSGLYEPATRLMKVVVLGRELPDLELLEWAAARKEGKLAGGKPVDAVAFVFPKEAEAKKNLDRLARYGHQVWAIRAGDEVRLDS
jgi:hypothetical protein